MIEIDGEIIAEIVKKINKFIFPFISSYYYYYYL